MIIIFKNPINLIFFLSFLIVTGCNKNDSLGSASPQQGKGGSMARFTISGNYLFAVDDRDLKVCEISNPQNPNFTQNINIGFGIETIYSFRNHLFIGSNQGMYIFNIDQPSNPKLISSFEHVLSCDPVVANDSLAFITLRSSSTCRWNTNINRLDVLDIRNIESPNLIKSYTVSEPWGIGLDENLLFVCLGKKGLNIYDISNPQNLILLKNISDIETYDVIPFNKILLVIGSSGFYQFEYSDVNNLNLLSQIKIGE